MAVISVAIDVPSTFPAKVVRRELIRQVLDDLAESVRDELVLSFASFPTGNNLIRHSLSAEVFGTPVEIKGMVYGLPVAYVDGKKW